MRKILRCWGEHDVGVFGMKFFFRVKLRIEFRNTVNRKWNWNKWKAIFPLFFYLNGNVIKLPRSLTRRRNESKWWWQTVIPGWWCYKFFIFSSQSGITLVPLELGGGGIVSFTRMVRTRVRKRRAGFSGWTRNRPIHSYFWCRFSLARNVCINSGIGRQIWDDVTGWKPVDFI